MEENCYRVETGQASVLDLSDEVFIINYYLQNKTAKAAIDEHLKEALSLVDMLDLLSPKIPTGQCRLIMHIAAGLKGKTTVGQSTARGTQSGGIAINGTVSFGSNFDEITKATNIPGQAAQPVSHYQRLPAWRKSD